jgi:murein DD-endopeptidase MepM/ murein hydrolase activator NlpD
MRNATRSPNHKTTTLDPLPPGNERMLDQPPRAKTPTVAVAPALAWPDVGTRPTLIRIERRNTAGRAFLKLTGALCGLLLPAIVAWLAIQSERTQPEPAAGEAFGPAAGSLPFSGFARQAEPSVALAEPMAPPPFDPAQLNPAPSGAPADEPQPTDRYETEVRLAKGDTVAGLLRDLDFGRDEVTKVVEALAQHISLRRLPVGQAMTLQVGAPDGTDDSRPVLQALTIRPEARREVRLERAASGAYEVREKVFETEERVARVSGRIEGSLIGSAEDAGVPHQAMAEMLKAFSWDVNFQHDIKLGDRFDVLIEQSWTTDGKPVDAGEVLWASLTTDGGAKTHTLYRFQPRGGTDFFYDREGNSVIKSLLRTPLNMSRISSRFGMRRHPLLGFTRLHAGIDFAAPTGTPILAAGAGTVAQAGYNGGYGRWVLIRHGNGLSTGYAHLHGIARGIRPGARVRQGQVIGFVGSSGLSTGPHLHFELHRNGKPVNPLSVARTEMRTRLSGVELARFKAEVARIDRKREAAGAPQ